MNNGGIIPFRSVVVKLYNPTLTLHLDSLRSPSGRGLVAQYSSERLAASFDLVAGRSPLLKKQLTCGSNGRSIAFPTSQSPKIELRTIKRRVPSFHRKIGREPGMFSFAEDQATATCCVAPRPSRTKSSLGTGREGRGRPWPHPKSPDTVDALNMNTLICMVLWLGGKKHEQYEHHEHPHLR